MANKTYTRENNFAAMMLQLHTQNVQQAMLQRELDTLRDQLAKASRTLAQKEQMIDSLEVDLEHMVDQLVKLQHNRAQTCGQQWIARAVPGLSTEGNLA